MVTIAISGFYGVQNAGDEAILASMLMDLKEVMPLADFVVFSLNPKHTSRVHEVRAVPCTWYKDWRAFFKSLRDADLFILGGGELVHDYSVLGHPAWGICCAKFLKKKTMLYALSARSFRTKFGRALIARALNYSDVITVRDSISKCFLNNLGINKPIFVTSDPSINLRPRSLAKEVLIKRGIIRDGRPLIGVNLREWCAFSRIWFKKRNLTRKIEMTIPRVVDSLIEKYNARIIFVPMQLSFDSRDDDLTAIYNVVSRMKKKSDVVIVKSMHDPREIKSLFGKMDLVIGMRLHSLIFASAMIVPVIAISYAPKVRGFMETLGQKEYCISLKNLDSIALLEKIEDLWNAKHEVKRKLKSTMRVLRRRAKLNAKFALELVQTSRN